MRHDLLFIAGLDHFNARRYFEAHEAWEDLWRQLEGERRSYVQALIQFAVALHHLSRGNERGARTLLERCDKRLAALHAEALPIDLEALRSEIARWRNALENGSAVPPAPVLTAPVTLVESMFWKLS